MNLATVRNYFFKIRLSTENTICLFIFCFASLICLILVQEGAAYAVDAGIYLNYIEHFLQFNFIFDVDPIYKFSFGYPLLVFPLVLILKKIILFSTTSFAFRLINIFAFSASSVLIYKLANLFTKKRYAILAALIFATGTPAIPITIDLWPQSISVFLLLIIIYSAIKYSKTNKLFLLVVNFLAMAFLFYIRNFELVFIFPAFLLIMYSIIKNNKTFKKKLLIISMCSLIMLLILIPYLYYNNIFFGNITGYYFSKTSTGIHEFSIKDYEQLKYRVINTFFHYTVDTPNNHSTKPILAIFQSSPILILALFGFLISFTKKKIYNIIFIILFISCSTIYLMFIFWHSFWAPAQRFFLPLFPILAIWSVIAIEKIFTNIKNNFYFFIGLISSLILIIISYFIYQPFFHTMITTNLGMWSNRWELKYFSITLYLLLIILYLIFICFYYLKKKNILNLIQGLFIPIIAVALLQGFFANAIASAAAIRYGNNVFPFFAKIKFFNYFGDYIAYGVNYQSPTSYKILFTIILMIFFLTARKLIISRILIKTKADL